MRGIGNSHQLQLTNSAPPPPKRSRTSGVSSGPSLGSAQGVTRWAAVAVVAQLADNTAAALHSGGGGGGGGEGESVVVGSNEPGGEGKASVLTGEGEASHTSSESGNSEGKGS